MALGNNTYSRNNNNNSNNGFNNGGYQPQVDLNSDGLRLLNPEGVDPSALNYQFFNGMLKITITPLKFNTDPNKKFVYDSENKIDMWLTPIKARIFYDEIINLLNHKDEINNAGVCTTSGGFILFSNGKEFSSETECLCIRKINENGEIIASYVYQFRANPNHFGIRNFDSDNVQKFDRVQYKNTEVENFLHVLKDFSDAMYGAYAYANMYYDKKNVGRMNWKLDSIMDKLGIEKSGNYSKNRGSSFFSNNPGNVGINAPASYNNYEDGGIIEDDNTYEG